MADPTKVEDYWFSDEFVEDMKLLKDWADKGYWSRSILSNTTDAGEQSGAFLPLDDLLDQVSPDYKAQIDPAALEGCRVNGKIMTIPCLWKQYTPAGIEYREDLREKYDLPVPDSIENLEAYFLRVLVMCFQEIFLFFPLVSVFADTALNRQYGDDSSRNFHVSCFY